jgi:hypothetical protein
MTYPRTSAAQHFGTLRQDCPTCGGHLYDLRGAGFNREQAPGCFVFGEGADERYECRGEKR